MLFTSEYECTLDAKGRLVLPNKIKSILPVESCNTLVVSRGFEPCLVIYPKSEWAHVFSKVAGLNEFNIEHRTFQRNFLRGNTEVELDKIGRFMLPKTLIDHAKLSKNLIIVGLGNRLELWDSEVYKQFLINDQEEFSLLAQKFLGNHTEDNELP